MLLKNEQFVNIVSTNAAFNSTFKIFLPEVERINNHDKRTGYEIFLWSIFSYVLDWHFYDFRVEHIGKDILAHLSEFPDNNSFSSIFRSLLSKSSAPLANALSEHSCRYFLRARRREQGSTDTQ